MSTRAWTLRTSALTAAGALAVHELRYGLAFGSGAQTRLAVTGHGYLAVITPALVAVLALGLAHLLARGVAAPERAPGVGHAGRLWAALSAALLGIYVAQELVEGALAAGHPAGLAGVLGGGGWVALPLVVAVGGLLAVALRGAAAASRATSARAARPPAVADSLVLGSPPLPRALPRSALSRRLAPRGPPSRLRLT